MECGKNGAATKLKKKGAEYEYEDQVEENGKKKIESSHSPERRGHNRIQRSTERCLCSLSNYVSLSLS